MARKPASEISEHGMPTYGPNVFPPLVAGEGRDEAWATLLDMLHNPPAPGPGACPPGQYGTRDEWYDDRSI